MAIGYTDEYECILFCNNVIPLQKEAAVTGGVHSIHVSMNWHWFLVELWHFIPTNSLGCSLNGILLKTRRVC